jgi:hypothetical protein
MIGLTGAGRAAIGSAAPDRVEAVRGTSLIPWVVGGEALGALHDKQSIGAGVEGWVLHAAVVAA